MDLADLFEATLMIRSALLTVDPESSMDDALGSMDGFLQWTVDVPDDEHDDIIEAAFAAFALADELALDARLTRLDRRRLIARIREIPPEQRNTVVLDASEDDAPPDVRSPIALLLTRIDRADPKFKHHERTAT